MKYGISKNDPRDFIFHNKHEIYKTVKQHI